MAVNSEDNRQYQSVFKALALFSGVQIWQILIGVIRSKLVAIIIGPTGMGITGLYTSSTELIKSCTAFGLNSSAVKFIAESNGTGDKQKLGRTVAVFKRLIWITGLLGMIATIIFSPLLSKSSFGDFSHIIPFILLSVTLLLQQLASGYLSVMQGVRHLKPLASSSIIGALIGLFTSIPLYYFFGTNGIVPSLIIASVTTLGLYWWYSRKIDIPIIKVSNKEAVTEGKGMIEMGIAMTLSGILATVAAYVIRIFISHRGGISDVGLYTAGMTILTTYVGMIFTAMGTDYFPRLSSMVSDKEKSHQLVNQESEVAILVLGLTVPIFILLAPIIIITLYSTQFLPIVLYIQIATLGIFFKAISWAISFLFLANGASKTFVINETIGNVITLVASVAGYYFWGLNGLGIAYLVTYFLYCLVVWIASMAKYSFKLSFSLIKETVIIIILTTLVFGCAVFCDSVVKYVAGGLIVVVSMVYSFIALNKRIDVATMCKQYLHIK